jgi:rhomboid protease GluP
VPSHTPETPLSHPDPQAHDPAAAAPARIPAVVLGPKPPDAEYGYFDGTPHASTRDELVARLREGQPTPYVWTPETDGVVYSWAVPYLFAAFRTQRMRNSRRLALIWAAVAAVVMGYAALFRTFEFIDPFVLGGFVAASLSFYSWLEWGRFRRLTPERLTVEARESRDRLPPRRGAPRYTQRVAASIALVVLVQAVAAVWLGKGIHIPIAPGSKEIIPSVDAAGMVKVAIRDWHEWWRLLSGAFLHDGLLHFGMNTLALLAIGRFLEAYAHRAYVPLVFLLTALAASTASYFFSPSPASVGASGGVLGLFGFLAVMARVRRRMLPPGFDRAIVADIAVVVAMGIFGWHYIDNVAHAGGFVAGAALGWLMIPRGGRTPYWEASKPIRVLGDVSLGILVLAALFTAAIIILRVIVWP